MATLEMKVIVDEQAVAQLKLLIDALDPFNPNTVDDLTDACFDLKGSGEALTAQLGQENLLLAAKAISETLRKMEELNMSESRESVFYYNVSVLFDEGGDKKQAIGMGMKAAELEPNNPRRSHWVACLYQNQHQRTEAVRWHRRTLDIDPTFQPAHHNLAVNYWMCGYYLLAQQEFKTEIAFTGEEELRSNKQLRYARRMVRYLEKKMELFGPEDEDACEPLDLKSP
jgi:tetratricopeptide (TPR) repeat protein